MTHQDKQEKSPNIKHRLNNLEAEINNIRNVLTKRKVKNVFSPDEHPQRMGLRGDKEGSRAHSKDRLVVNKDICSYLQNITKHIAKGSEAIRRIASLTEVSSLTQTSVTPLGSDQGSDYSELQKKSNSSSPFASRLFNSLSDQLISEKSRSKLPCDVFERLNVDEKQTKGNAIARKGIIEVKKQILQENCLLKQKLADENVLKSEISDLKKKLKEESKKRFAAEKKVEDAEKTLSEQQKQEASRKEQVNKDSIQSKGDGILVSLQDKLTVLEEKYADEKRQREELEKEMTSVRFTLEENERQKAGLSQARDIALAVADKLWSRCERRESSSFGRQGGSQKYKTYLSKLSKATAPDEAQAIYEKIKEQILAAEKHRESPPKDPLEDPQVQSLVERHRKAYYDLEKAKNQNEIEQEQKIKYLEASLGQLQQHYTVKTRKLLDRVQELTQQLKAKSMEIEAMTEKKISLAEQNHRETIDSLETKNKRQEEILQSKEQTINKLENELKNFRKEIDEARQQFHELNQLVEETKTELLEKAEMIDNMKSEIESKNEALAIKEKMIADNVDTIKALKMAVDANRQIVDDMKNAGSSLKNEKLRLEKENEKLSRNINHLERVVEEANIYKAAQERNLVQLKNLETQVYAKQKDWEQQLMKMTNEKDEAIAAARLATQKLYRAVHDFEKQLIAHKKSESQLRRALQQREAKLSDLKRQEDQLLEDELGERRPTVALNNVPRPVNTCTDFVDSYSSTTTTTSTESSI